jgi:hypothetical protein
VRVHAKDIMYFQTKTHITPAYRARPTTVYQPFAVTPPLQRNATLSRRELSRIVAEMID